MKKLHVALAFAGAVAGSAYAQPTVEVYGILDMGFVRESGRVNDLTTGSFVEPSLTSVSPGGNKLSSGVQSGTRLGFKGTEDLGGGLKALFVLETGIGADRGGFNQGNLAFGRQSFAGLQGDFGTVTLGRQLTSYFLTLNQVADPFASGLAGNAQNLMLPGAVPNITAYTGTGGPATNDPTGDGLEADRAIRMNNAIKYASPIISGFSDEVAYGFGETAGSNSTNRVITGSIGYSVKPVSIRLAHYRKNSVLPSLSNADSLSSTMLAANWDLGVAKVFAAYADNDWAAAGKSRDYLIGASAPFGPHTFIASYIRKDVRNSRDDANQWGLGYTYALSKRTNLYAAYGRISNKGEATFTVGNNSENGTSNAAFNLGVRHLF